MSIFVLLTDQKGGAYAQIFGYYLFTGLCYVMTTLQLERRVVSVYTSIDRAEPMPKNSQFELTCCRDKASLWQLDTIMYDAIHVVRLLLFEC